MKNGLHQTTWRAIAASMHIPWCASEQGCGLGRKAHIEGRVAWGRIHWHGFNRVRATRRGLRHFLKLAALVENPEWRAEPTWLRLYHQNTWAYREAQRQFHIRLRAAEAIKDQERVLDLTIRRRNRIKLRTDHPNVYGWVVNWRYRDERQNRHADERGTIGA